MRRAAIFALVFLFAPAAANAAAPGTGGKAALALTDGFVVPHYRALAEAADAQVRAWDVFCKAGGRGRDDALRAAYNSAADRWAEVEFFKSGPMSLFLRSERFNYWPEVHNATTTALTALLAAKDASAFTSARLVYDNIPAQGLPAIERLLYDPAFSQSPNRCRVGAGIAKNLSTIAHEVLNAWAGANGARGAIAANKPWNNNLFTNADEAAGMLATDMVGAITIMDDQKLLAPMGPSAPVAKPHMAEAWRSGRSARDLVLNVTALAGMERLLAVGMNAADRAKLDSAFAAATGAVKALPSDIPAAVSNAGERAKFTAARAALKAAQAAMVAVLPKALNISLGFNSLDGD